MKLSGIRVVDLSQFLPGPMLTLMMADQGAEVVKVEPPAGDPAREMAPFEDGQSVWFRNLNRGKRSVRVDLKSDAGRDGLKQMIANADVFVEGFRPGVMKRLGFDYAAARSINPRIVYCSISAFGQEGPFAHHPAHDLAVQALSGFLSVNNVPGEAPAVPGVPSADMAAGLTGLSAILMALIGRERTGKGDYIDIDMLSAMLPWSAHIAGGALMGEAAPDSGTQRSLGGAGFYNVYRTSDDRHVVLGAREMKFVKTLLTDLEREDLIPLGAAEPGAAQQPLKDFLAETFAGRTRDTWESWFDGRDVAFSPVLDFAEAYGRAPASAHVSAHSGRHHIRPAIRFQDEEAWVPGNDA